MSRLWNSDAPDWKALYESEREEVRRLTKVVEKMRRQGFVAAPDRAVVVVPKQPESQAVEREEETVIRPIMQVLQAERPDLDDVTLAVEARRLMQAAMGGG